MFKRLAASCFFALFLFIPQGVGVGTSPNLQNARGAGKSTLDDANLVAYWNLDETSGTRVKTAGSCASCDLTAVNSPVAMGGAGNYALSTTGTTQGVTNTTSTELQNFTTSSFTVAIWSNLRTASTSYVLATHNAGTTRGIDVYNNSNSGWVWRTYQASGSTNTCGGNSALPGRLLSKPYFVALTYDTTIGTYGSTSAYRDNTTTWTNVACTAAMSANTGLGVGISNIANTGGDQVLGPLMIWSAAKSASDISAIYNSGLGYTCSNLPSALRTNLLACWDLNEASGTRAASTAVGASCTTNCNLTAANTPGRAAGLVQNSMGMSASVATNQSLGAADNADLSLGGHQSFEACAWALAKTGAWGSQTIAGKWLTGGDPPNAEWLLYGSAANAVSLGLSTGSTVGVTVATKTFTADTNWHLVCGRLDDPNSLGYVSVDASDSTGGAWATVTNNSPRAFRIGTFDDVTTYPFNGYIDAVGFWKGRTLTAGERTALYNAGAGVEYPWTTIVSLFNPFQRWADLDIEKKQRIVYAKTGVFVPSYMFPSRKVVVVQ